VLPGYDVQTPLSRKAEHIIPIRGFPVNIIGRGSGGKGLGARDWGLGGKREMVGSNYEL
jgi:hypothetical protein